MLSSFNKKCPRFIFFLAEDKDIKQASSEAGVGAGTRTKEEVWEGAGTEFGAKGWTSADNPRWEDWLVLRGLHSFILTFHKKFNFIYGKY